METNSFLYESMIYLAAAVLMVPLARRTGLGSVLGYLLAGILIGPAVLDLLGTRGENVMHFAEFGVVMMLFLVGLEVDPKLLWQWKNRILGMGGLQIILTAAAIAGLALFFDLEWEKALAIGLIAALSSTAIILQTLTEKGLMDTVAGRNAFSVLLMQDIAVIPMLALFPLLGNRKLGLEGEDPEGHSTFVNSLPGWGQTLVVLGAVLGILLVARFLLKPLVRYVAATAVRELLTGVGLLIVISITVLMIYLGLSPALGSFLAGVVMANSEFKHELAADIEPFKGILLGLFFIAIGATIDFNMILAQPWTILGLVLALMITKALILFLLGKIFRMRLDQNLLFSLALSQVGEFAFVLLSFSRSEYILRRSTIDLMTAVVVVSMALTPLILLVYDRFLKPITGTKQRSDSSPADDTIEEKNEVIIAGFGHFGNIVGRFLRANKVGLTILENDSDRVELLRKLGLKVYYGDATRYDLLVTAGAAEARLIIITLDPAERRASLVRTVKKNFPHLKIYVRANNRIDAYDLINAGLDNVYRETLDTSLRMGVEVMTELGFQEDESKRAAELFLQRDETYLKRLAKIEDRDEYISRARGYIEELETLIRSDIQKGQDDPDEPSEQ